ncbi:MAG: FKBP-type peptidyl-prolyl cis-trans isomerase [Bdellovibrionaceae bacterium]|nr:FKBP-type peptidyl-prolyl cis-trans isomerase [Pseudobdellovibrionaceae bacterium]
MRKLLLIAPMALFALQMGCEKKPKLDNDMSRASYAIGQQIGSNLKNQNLELDKDALSISIKDVLENKPSRLKPEEIQQALMKLQETINTKQAAAATENAEKGKAFLETNKAAAGVKTTSSGLQIQITEEGKGKVPTEKDTVKAHYKGALIDGKVFDSSYDRGQPAEFPVNQVIKGWTEALTSMKVGTKARLFIPPELGYGPNDRPGIPANSVLVFDVELLDIVPVKK